MSLSMSTDAILDILTLSGFGALVIGLALLHLREREADQGREDR